MSLLGKLFSTLPATGAVQSPLDSNLEDHFTHNLLFPDPEALCHNDQVFPLTAGTILTPAVVNAFDVHGEWDLDTRDVRVVIMQEATATSGGAYVLYDSHPSPPPSVPTNPTFPPREGRRSISAPRKPSSGHNARPVIVQEAAPRVLGAFERRPPPSKTWGPNETESQRSLREYREEVATMASCIFGNSDTLAYKGTGTKMHTLPAESRSFTPGSYLGEGSLGRASMRGSKLAQSFTSDHVSPHPSSAGLTNLSTTSRPSDRKKILITRMFPVPLPADETDEGLSRTPITQSADSTGYPFPSPGETASPEKKPQPKQKRTPMYAVGLVVHLPSAGQAPGLASRPSFRGPSSYTEQESFPSSFNSSRRSGWSMVGQEFGVESMESSFSIDVDDRIDTVIQHWDIIMRTLSHLQAVATSLLLPMLKQADISSPEPRHVRSTSTVSVGGKRVEDTKPFKLPKTNAKMVQLLAHCLQPVQKVHEEVDAARLRIVGGFKSCQVVTGQNRWGIWREEARLVGKWAGTKDEGFFFFNFLTAFLGSHTEWLKALGPSWYRRRCHQQQRAHKDDEICLPARTIIVSDNKLMARRLIFLLSAFLPANAQLPSSRLHRPSTSTSFGGFSQSPPTYPVPILREESLRRRINKRTNAARIHHSRTMSFPAQPGPEIHYHGRRPSDVTSIKTANLPIPGSDIGTRKSSAATTSTATPVTTMPHFSTGRRPMRGTGPHPRPGSSGSVAADDLIRSLQRGDSTGQYSHASSDSQANSKWGSMISGFWSSKRRGSTATSSPPHMEGLEISPKNSGARRGNLQQMVDEAGSLKASNLGEHELRKSESSSATARRDSIQDETPEQRYQAPDRTPNPAGAYESPVKTTINTSDGVIDIAVALPDYLSYETAVSSPSSSGYSFSNTGFGNAMEGFEHSSRAAPDVETTMNAGGWLPRYHPDFTLQAIPRPTDNAYVEEIKESLRAEPTPAMSLTPHPDNSDGRWVDIASAIIADTTSFTIKHIRYRRFIRPSFIDSSTPAQPYTAEGKYGNVYSNALLSPSLPSSQTNAVEERFEEEYITSMDNTLIEAVERITAQSGPSSQNPSASSSRAPSCKGGSRDPRSGSSPPSVPESNLEVPRNECKKMVLTALEDIVRSVVDGRNKESQEEAEEGGLRGTAREKESFLREGVRAWLGSIECAD